MVSNRLHWRSGFRLTVVFVGAGAGTYEQDVKHPVDSAEAARTQPVKSGSSTFPFAAITASTSMLTKYTVGDRVGAKIEKGAGMLGGMIHGINHGKDRFNDGLDNGVSNGGRSWSQKNQDMVRGINQGIDNAAGTGHRAAHEGYQEGATEAEVRATGPPTTNRF